MYEAIVSKTAEFVKNKLSNEASGHDWWHIYRVWNTGRKIALVEGANTFIVEMICLQHDLTDYKLFKGTKEEGRQLLKNWMSQVGVDENSTASVIEQIENMSFKSSKSVTKELTLEGKCAQDADRLDAIGAIGIARCFAYNGFKGNILHDPSLKPNLDMSEEQYVKSQSTAIQHFYEKLLLLKDKLNTEAAKKMAEGRHEFMNKFLEQFYAEWG